MQSPGRHLVLFVSSQISYHMLSIRVCWVQNRMWCIKIWYSSSIFHPLIYTDKQYFFRLIASGLSKRIVITLYFIFLERTWLTDEIFWPTKICTMSSTCVLSSKTILQRSVLKILRENHAARLSAWTCCLIEHEVFRFDKVESIWSLWTVEPRELSPPFPIPHYFNL